MDKDEIHRLIEKQEGIQKLLDKTNAQLIELDKCEVLLKHSINFMERELERIKKKA